ncbi:MAG: dynamin family protein [Desulfamplus sp.]
MDINQENIDIFKKKFSEAINIAGNLYFEDKVSIGKGLLNKLEQGELMLAFIGSTSAGKSTVINNLIQSTILPVSTIPTTGAMTLIRVMNDLSKSTFSKVSLKDGDLSVLDDDKVFAELSKNGHCPKKLVRSKFHHKQLLNG